MIPTSLLFQEAMAYSRTMFAEADIVYNGTVLENDVPISEGTMTTDRGSNARYSASLTLALNTWDSLPLDVNGTRIRLRTGLDSIGVREVLPIGEYLAFDYVNDYKGDLKLTLKGLEQLVIDDKFPRPRTPPYGASTVDTITTLIQETLPDAQIVVLCSLDRPVLDTSIWQRERWDTITALGNSILAEVYCGYDGRWYIIDRPDLNNLVPVYSVIAGPTGVVIEESVSKSRDKVYNAWSVAGQSADATIAPPYAFVSDDNPNSPTYYGGPFGKEIGFYTSQFFTEDSQCLAYAQSLLTESLSYTSQMKLSAGPLPLLEAGDAVAVSDNLGRPLPSQLLEQTTLPLGTGTWNATCTATGSPAGSAA